MSKFALVLVLGIISSCASSDADSKKIGDSYELLVMNEVMSNPLFKCNECWFANNQEFTEIKNQILANRLQVYDKDLKITLIAHIISDNAYPNIVIYVFGAFGFEYAFSFNDEAYYLEKPHLISDPVSKYRNLRHLNLESQLNTIASRLMINSPYDRGKLDRFTTLFFITLLKMTELNELNFQEFTKNMKAGIDAPDDSCKFNLEKNLKYIEESIDRDEARFFHAFAGTFGFWKVRIEYNNQLRPVLRLTFENSQCYSGYFL